MPMQRHFCLTHIAEQRRWAAMLSSCVTCGRPFARARRAAGCMAALVPLLAPPDASAAAAPGAADPPPSAAGPPGLARLRAAALRLLGALLRAEPVAAGRALLEAGGVPYLCCALACPPVSLHQMNLPGNVAFLPGNVLLRACQLTSCAGWQQPSEGLSPDPRLCQLTSFAGWPMASQGLSADL